MVHIPVVVGEWVRRDNCSFFEVDHAMGGRLFHLREGCKQEELVGMVCEDYLLDKETVAVELSYSLPDEMLKMMPADTPPTVVSSDRQVRVLMELCRTSLVRLCVSVRYSDGEAGYASARKPHNDCEEGDLGVHKYEADVHGEGGHEVNDDDSEDDGEWEPDSDDLEEEVGGEAEDDEECVKADLYDSDIDYSVYGKVKDEDNDEINVPFDASLIKPTERWSDIISVGKSYRDKNELLLELRMTAIMQKFAFTSAKSNKTCLVAKCYVEGCQWKVRATVKNEPGVFWVTKYVNVHTCSIADRRSNRRRCTPRYIAHLFIERVGIIDGIVPKHIKDSMRNAYGLRMDYSTSYRALIFARALVRGTAESGYETLPMYLKQIEETNAGSVTDLVIDEENRFKYLFLSLGASIHGFQYCRRVIIVDGTHLTGEYGGVLLVAAGQDANFQVFFLAFAIVDGECDESWDFFFRNLKRCFTDGFPMAIISDRHSSIAKACQSNLPWAERGICYYHLQQNIITTYRGKHLMHLVRGAAYAYTIHEYDRNMGLLRHAHPDLATYLEGADPKLWARVHFPGHRYNIQTSNIAESINSVVKQAKEFPIAYLLEFIRERLGLWFWRRREDALRLTTHFSRGVETLLAIRGEKADTMQVNRIDMWVFQVIHKQRDFTVDLSTRSCSCGVYSVEMIPCSHALAAITESGIHVSNFVCNSYAKNSLYGCYSLNVYPKGQTEAMGSAPLRPPLVRPTPGRKKKSRWQTWLELSRKRKRSVLPRKRTKHYNCSKCKQPGHRRPNCVNID